MSNRTQKSETRYEGIEETAAAVTLKRHVRGLAVSFGVGFLSSIAATMATNSMSPPQCPVNFNCIPMVMVPMTTTPTHDTQTQTQTREVETVDLGAFSGAP